MICILRTRHTHEEQNSPLDVVPKPIVTHYGTNIDHHSTMEVCPVNKNKSIIYRIQLSID